MNEWPFEGGPGKATAAQVGLMALAWLDHLPKRERPEGDRAPHGKVDTLTMQQWRERHKKALEDNANGTA